MRDYAFGNLVTKLRTELGFSQFQLGKLIGVSDKAVRAFQGMLLFFVLACDTLIHYRVRIVGLAVPQTATAKTPVAAGEAGSNA